MFKFFMASSKETYQRLHKILNKSQVWVFIHPYSYPLRKKSSISVRQDFPLTKLHLLHVLRDLLAYPGHEVKIEGKFPSYFCFENF